MGQAIQDKETISYGVLEPIVVRLLPALRLSDDQFFELAQINHDLRLERNARGELIIMPPTGGETGDRNAEITMQLRMWAKRNGTGTAFDSSTGFSLPNSAVRSPDASWVRNSRLAALTSDQLKKFIPLCPDFVIELRSASDTLADLREKMLEYLENGALLGWLIDPDNRRVYVYRPGEPVQQLDDLDSLSSAVLLPGFELMLLEIW
ncbi:MAG: Uma2 family endonuclease [Blastocatellia bacterium]